MFKLVKMTEMKSINWPVMVSVPQDGGNVMKYSFTADFNLLSGPDFQAIYNKGGNDEDLLRSVVVGFGADLQDQQGAVIPFSAENLEAVIAVPYVRGAMVNAYLDLSNGRKASTKN